MQGCTHSSVLFGIVDVVMRQADGAQLGIAWSNEQVLGYLDFTGDTC